MKKTLFYAAIAIAGILSIGGCARNISSSSYDARKVGTASETYECTVVSVRKVMVEEGDYLENNMTGALMGAAAGGVLGNMVGGGRGRTAATVVGALAGGAGGAIAEKHLKSQEGLEYVVKLSTGAIRTVVQGLDNPLYQGQAALLIIDRNRARVIPRNY